MIQKAKGDYHKRLLQENSRNLHNFWKYIKEIISNKSKNKSSNSVPFIKSPIRNALKSKAQVFCQFFSKIARSLKEKAFLLKNTVWNYNSSRKLRTTATFKFDYVSVTFVQSKLKKIKKNKAAGLDELPGVLIKDSASVISKPLSYFLNLPSKTCQVPRDWKIMKITPIFKSGDSTNTDNYRPLSVLPIISKVLKRAVHMQIMNYLEKYNLLSNN